LLSVDDEGLPCDEQLDAMRYSQARKFSRWDARHRMNAMSGAVDAAEYHRWYETRRGRWIGDLEYDLMHRLLHPEHGASILDVGCGTGYFTHRFARAGHTLTGLDPALHWLSFAKGDATPGEYYVAGRAERMPFADRSFDHTISIAALCFMADPTPGIAEIVRVTRHRFAIGLLNRQSLLYRKKGRGHGTGAYRGACWYTAAEIRRFFAGLTVEHLRIRSAVFEPRGVLLSRSVEHLVPSALPFGAFIVAAGEVRRKRGI
jgi:SAM-dependent methyltransferase